MGINVEAKNSKDGKRKEAEYIPKLDGGSSLSAVDRDKGDVADLGSKMRASRFRAGREGSGPFHPTKNLEDKCLFLFCFRVRVTVICAFSTCLSFSAYGTRYAPEEMRTDRG